ncbi:MAG: CoA ester lyase [Anaerolineae bacterium]
MSRPRRVLLFMPGDDLRKITKGAASGVDSVIMDLEDAVAVGRKETARDVVAEALATLDFGGSERLVRVNGLTTGLAGADVAATIGARPDGYMIPKVESAAQIQEIDALLTQAEAAQGWPSRGIRLLAIVETARGVMRLDDIAASSPRLDALCFGAEDLAGDIGARRTPEGAEVFYARSAVVIAAAAYGLQAIDTPYVDLQNIEGLTADARRAAGMGYSGKLAIHPRHIAPILAAFTPTAEEVAAAQRLVDACAASQAAGAGAFALDGKMVDTPMLRAAQRVLARAGRHIA